MLPSGLLALCFTDIEASTALVRVLGDEFYEQALNDHRAIIRAAVARCRGYEVKTEGDGLFLVFTSVVDAVDACVEAQIRLSRHAWPLGASVNVRAGIHFGSATLTDDHDYVGLAVHQAARVSAAAHGGQIIVSSTAAAAMGEQAVAGVELHDLGPYQLRDFDSSVRLFQVHHDDLVGRFPPPRAPLAIATNLPTIPTTFIGRDLALEDIVELLGRVPLITISGTGGVGKTRIAIEAAHTVVGQFDGGAWFVELAGLTEDRQVAGAFLHALSLTQAPAGDATMQLVDHLRDRQALLVVDNCEHVLDGVAAVIRAVLEQCRGVKLLATSREPLRVRGEHVWDLAPLAVPASAADNMRESPAVVLFLDRARAASSRFHVDVDASSALRALCRALDGIPLALELAAARTREFDMVKLHEQVVASLDVLESGYRTDPARQQTVRGMVRWSYELLDAETGVAFRCLGVFRGGWTIDAAAAVLDRSHDECEALCFALGERSLAVQHGDRWRFLEPVRQCATELASEAGELDAAQRAHFRWCRSLAHECSKNIDGPKGKDYLARYESEHDNLRAALAWGTDAGLLETLDVACDMFPLWVRRGHTAEGRRWLEAILATCEAGDREARALRHLGIYAHRAGDVARAEELWTAALASSIQHEQHGQAAQSLNALGNLARVRGATTNAVSLFKQSLDRARQSGDDGLVSEALGNLGTASHASGDTDRAYEYYTESIEIARRVGNESSAWNSLNNLGLLFHERGDLHQAIAHWEEALNIARERGDRHQEAFQLANLAAAVDDLGDQPRSVELGDTAAAIFEEIGDKESLAQTLGNRAMPMLEMGRIDQALSDVVRSIVALAEVGNQVHMCKLLDVLACIHNAARRPTQAARAIGLATALRRRMEATLLGADLDIAQKAENGARAQLGDVEFDELTAQGAKLSLATVLSEALPQTALPAIVATITA